MSLNFTVNKVWYLSWEERVINYSKEFQTCAPIGVESEDGEREGFVFIISPKSINQILHIQSEVSKEFD